MLKKFRKKKKKLNKIITYYDPYHLVRYFQVSEAPHKIIEITASGNFMEMDQIKQNAWCCDA